MARAAVQALPLDLNRLCQALNLPVKKDLEGNRLMMQMCKPRKARKGKDPAGTIAISKLVSLATRWDELNTNVQASG
jgi:hypothetical protein